MSNKTTTLFPDEPQPQSQNCYVDPWNYWRPLGSPWQAWIIRDATTTPIPEKPVEDKDDDEDLRQDWQIEDEADEDEEPEQAGEDEEGLALTMNDVETMLRRVIREELGSLRIVQGKQ